MSVLTLGTIPGYADLPDLSISHDDPVLGIHINKIVQNASFGMANFEVFSGNYVNGQTVALPISNFDGYQYARSELIYRWGVASTLNPSSGWISGLDSLWYAAWNVKNWIDPSMSNPNPDNSQAGLVETVEWYRRSGGNATPTSSNDGTLFVITIAQRLRNSLVMSAQADSFSDVADSAFVTDAAFTETIVQTMNRNAKLGVAGAECIFMGEFKNGDTVAQPKSLKDGYVYSYSQCAFDASWRWTTSGASFTQPAMATGQLAPMIFSIDGTTGAVTVSVYYVEDSGDLTLETGFGRIAVFAFCSRTNLVTLGATANSFTELDQSKFFPGQPLEAADLLQINKNIRESAVNVEFFGPTEYANHTTISLPTSTIDSYAYSRDECQYLWEWSDTTPDSGNNLRVLGWIASVSSAGFLAINVWRLPPGEKYVIAGSGEHMRLRVTTVAVRGSVPQTIVNASSNEPSDGGSVPDQGSGSSGDGSVGGGTGAVTVNEPYIISYYSGPNGQPSVSDILLAHQIGGLVNTGASFPTGLSGSYVGCRVAPSADFVITMKNGSTTVGTMTIPSGTTTGTFSFTADVSTVPGDLWTFIALGTADTSIAGIRFTLSGVRAAGGTINSTPTSPGSTTNPPGTVGDDMLDWMLNTDRANTHLTGTHPMYTYASGNKQAFIKGPAGNPWDINLVDSSYIYLWITENGDEGPTGPGSSWLNASAFKRFPANGKGYPTPQGVPFCPRYFNTSGSAVSVDTPTPNNSHRTLSCETDGEALINIGAIRCTTNPPVSINHGGDVGTQPTIIIEYFYGSGPYHARERFYLVKGLGEVKWDVSSGTYPSSYTVSQTSTFNIKAVGGTPKLNFPCSATVSWWI